MIVENPSPAAAGALPLWLVTDGSLQGWLAEQGAEVANWVRANGFLAEKQRALMLPGASGHPAGAVVGLGSLPSVNELKLWHAAGLSDRLAPATYRLATPLSAGAATQFTLGWLVGAYRFTRYRAAPTTDRASLVAPAGADLTYAEAAASASALARDLVNTPANDLGPAELAAAATDLAHRFGGTIKITVGDELKADRFPLIYAVGAGSPRHPRLIDLRWGKPGGLRVTLVGKGVCFDTGGLDIKPSAGMLLMKKDMGGAACALGVAQLLMQLDAPVQLRVLIPAVENSVDGHSYRPSDVIPSRKGLTVEIGNTDAEGRLVLADALAEADAEKPDLLIDLATLTGAARVALGPELPAAYSTDAALLATLQKIGEAEMDPVWPMPLWAGYDDELSSKVADLGNGVRGLPDRGTVPQALRHRHAALVAHRPVRLESEGAAGPAGGRRSAMRAQRLPAHPFGLRVSAIRASDLLLLVGITFIWGLNLITSKVGIGEIPPILFTFLRFAIVATVLAPWLRIQPGQMSALVVASLLIGAISFALNFAALRRATSISSIAIAGQLSVPFATLLSVALLDETVRWRRWTGIVLSFVGVVIMGFDPAIGARWESLALVIGSAFAGALGLIAVKKLRGFRPLGLLAWTAWIGMPVLFLTSLRVEQPDFVQLIHHVSWKGWAALAFAAVGASLVAHTGYFHLVQKYPVTSVAPLTTLSPVFAVIFSVLLLGEPLSGHVLLGGFCTLLGVFIITMREKRIVDTGS